MILFILLLYVSLRLREYPADIDTLDVGVTFETPNIFDQYLYEERVDMWLSSDAISGSTANSSLARSLLKQLDMDTDK